MAPRPASSPYRKALGRAFAKRRAELEMSQEDVAFEAEVDRTYLTGLEAGSRNPTLETILRVANALDVKPSALLAEAEAGIGRRR